MSTLPRDRRRLRPAPRLLLLLTVTVAGVILAGCGGDDNDSAGDAATTTAADSDGTTTAGSTDQATSAAASTAAPDTTAAGGSGGSGGPELADVDPCQLLQPAEIEPIVGNPVGEPEPNPFSCSWTAEELDALDVTVSVFTAAPREPAQACAAQRDVSPDAVDVEGFGDTAWWDYTDLGSSYSNGDLWVCVGDGYLAVGVMGSGDDASARAAVEQLARLVLDRL